MTFLWDLVQVVILSFVLMRATDLLVGSLHRLSLRSSFNAFGLSAFLVALSTSLPELFVGITSALEGKPALALGNVLGSNVANASLVVGLAALVSGSVGVMGKFFRQDFFTAFLAGALPLLLLLDGTLGVVDGVALVVVYVIYNLTTIGQGESRKQHHAKLTARLSRRFAHWQTDKEVLWLLVGAGLLLLSADLLVRVAEDIATGLHVPVFLIGLLLLPVGTTLPELSFAIEAIRKKEVGMVYGDFLGSVVTNATLILGLAAIISPIRLTDGLQPYLLATMAFVVVFAAFWFLVNSKKRLERWEGALLLGIYFLFVLLEIKRAG